MYWSKNTIAKAKEYVVSGLTGRECYVCVVCGQDISSNGAKVMDVDSYDEDGHAVWSFHDAPGSGSRIKTSIPSSGYAHKKCFNIQAVKVKLQGSFHATNGKYVTQNPE